MQHARGLLLNAICRRDILLPAANGAATAAAAAAASSGSARAASSFVAAQQQQQQQQRASAPPPPSPPFLLLHPRCLTTSSVAADASSSAADPSSTSNATSSTSSSNTNSTSTSSSSPSSSPSSQPTSRPPPSPMRTRLVLAALRSSDAPLTSHDLHARGRELYPDHFPASRARFKQLVAWLKRAGWARARPSARRNQPFVLSATAAGLRQPLDDGGAAPAESWRLRLARKEAAAIKARIAQARGAE